MVLVMWIVFWGFFCLSSFDSVQIMGMAKWLL